MKKILINDSLWMKVLLFSISLVMVGSSCCAQTADKIIDKYKNYNGAEYVSYNKSELTDLYKEIPEGNYMKILAKKADAIKALSNNEISEKKQKEIHELVQDLDESNYSKLVDEKDNEGNIISIWFLENSKNYLITDVFIYLVDKGKTTMLLYAKGSYSESDIEKVEGLLLP